MSSSTTSVAPRYGTPPSPDRPTYGERVARVARLLGFELMPWQRSVADIATELVPGPLEHAWSGGLCRRCHLTPMAAPYDHRCAIPAYRRVVLTVPRQSGKTTLLLAMFVERLTRPGRHDIVYGAQDLKSAEAQWEEQVHRFTTSAIGARMPHRIIMSNGARSLRLNGTRSTWQPTSNTEKAGHGMTPALVCLDEAFALVDARLEQAYVAAMKNVPDGQFLVVSTAGTATSLYLRSQVDAGRIAALEGRTTGTAYFEWSAPDDADPADESVWAACMPALGHTNETLEQLRADFRGFLETDRLGEWRRAYLNQWTATDERVIPSAVWSRAERAELELGRPLVLALEISADRSTATIAAAGAVAPGGLSGVAIVHHAPGVDWITTELGRLCRDLRPAAVWVDRGGPAASHLAELAARIPVPIDTTNTGQFTGACARFLDELTAGTVVHRADPPLDMAVAAAAKRPVGDTWAWGRTRSAGDIGPLVAASLALAGHRDQERRRPSIA
jgi:hypothetical protein